MPLTPSDSVCFATSRFPKARGALRQRHADTPSRHCPLKREEPEKLGRSKHDLRRGWGGLDGFRSGSVSSVGRIAW